MKNEGQAKGLTRKEILILLIILIAGSLYVVYIRKNRIIQEKEKVLQISCSIAASLPKDEIKSLPDNPSELKVQDFTHLKESLQKVILVNKNARFAYLYINRNDKLYFLVDSEPETSADYSPPGQEYTEATLVDKKPFKDGMALVTEPLTDRWGTWVSTEVPVKNDKTGEVIAVFGMDYNANSWTKRIWFDVFQSILLFLVILFLLIVARRSLNNNSLLRKEMAQREKAEKSLKKNELTFSHLVSNLPGLVYRCELDENYTIEFMSDACIHITGYFPEDFIRNKNISYNDLILAEYRTVTIGKWINNLNERSVYEDEYPIKTASGEIKWVWERGRCVFAENGEPQYFEGYIEDITNRKLAEKELRKLSQAIEQNPASVVITDSEGTIEYVNPRFTEITGYEASEVIGQNPRILKSGKLEPEIYTNLWETITSGKIWNGELINKNKKGELYWANKSISPIIDELGKITNYVAIGEDISQKKEFEAELIKAKEKAEESDRLKSAFLANISHEIRTPMNGILGFAELLKEPDLSPENQKEFLGIIEQSGQRMLNIINDLMDISKIEAGEITLRIRKTNINKMLNELHLFFMPESIQKNIQLDFHCDLSEDESYLETDSTKLNQILTNLIKNALKFTDKGSVTFGYQYKNRMLEFSVTDTGPGISPEQANLIFERFRQASQGTTRKHEGAGLGLAISKAYIELLGGSIWMESELGKGSTFFFELPIQATVTN